MMTRAEKEAVLIGFYLDGKELQVRERGAWSTWHRVNGQPAWGSLALEWRLKPEPVAGWFIRVGSGSLAPAYRETKDAIYMRECDPPEEGK